jgi:hypothetical protein
VVDLNAAPCASDCSNSAAQTALDVQNGVVIGDLSDAVGGHFATPWKKR